MGWLRVESDIKRERDAQDAKWGEQNHPDGTREAWAVDTDYARTRCKNAFSEGVGTWEHILTEEIYEAYAETDPEKLRVELVQCAAVIVAWIEAIDRRTAWARVAGATFPGEVTDS